MSKNEIEKENDIIMQEYQLKYNNIIQYRIYNDITLTCFNKCIKQFNSKILNEKEYNCVDNCISKYMKGYDRIINIYNDYEHPVIDISK